MQLKLMSLAYGWLAPFEDVSVVSSEWKKPDGSTIWILHMNLPGTRLPIVQTIEPDTDEYDRMGMYDPWLQESCSRMSYDSDKEFADRIVSKGFCDDQAMWYKAAHESVEEVELYSYLGGDK